MSGTLLNAPRTCERRKNKAISTIQTKQDIEKQRNAWMDKQYDKRIRRARRRPESRNTPRFTQNDTKNIKLENTRPWWNTWFLVQEIYLHSRQTSTRNEEMLTRSTHTRMDNQRKNHIDPKWPKQRSRPKNYRPITCLRMMWKILTAQIREEIFCSLTSRRLFPDKQIGYCKGSRGTADLLYIDKNILNESKTRRLWFRKAG